MSIKDTDASAPERIWAKRDRATVYMDGSSPLTARTREFPGAVEYVRADALAPAPAAEKAEPFGCPTPGACSCLSEADALASLTAENDRLREALHRLINPAPGVKRLPPWVYGIARAALTDGGSNGE